MNKLLVSLLGASVALYAVNWYFKSKSSAASLPVTQPITIQPQQPTSSTGTGFSLNLDFLLGPQEPEPTLIAKTTTPTTMMTPSFTAPKTTVTVPSILAIPSKQETIDIVPEEPKPKVSYESIPEGDIRRQTYWIQDPLAPSVLVAPTAIPSPTMYGPSV